MNLRLVLMDQQKMGMFISELRKKNKLNKKELVNMLEIKILWEYLKKIIRKMNIN